MGPHLPIAFSLKNSIFIPPHLKSHTKQDEEAEEEEQADPRPKQGRMYATKYSEEPGGIKVDDMIFGMCMSHLSCTDDSDERLKYSGPNTIQALELIAGSPEEARKPLSWILKEKFDLTLDAWINESGFLRGRPVDTQGFIASNDTTIVLSYRFSTSIMDWMTNISMASSEWEPHKDELQGHAGDCSCFKGWYTKLFFPLRGKPRVHTGFYNNFVYTIPYLRDYILGPLCRPGAAPKRVFICGESLGAALATMAFMWLLQEMEPKLTDPNFVNHKLFNVTAGSPRVCDQQMKDRIMAIMNQLRPLDRAVIARLVYNHDLVPHIPFRMNRIDYVHLDKLVYITSMGEVIVNPKLEKNSNIWEVIYVFENFFKSIHQINKAKSQQKLQKVKSKRKFKPLKEDNESKEDKENGKDEEKDATDKEEKTAFELECENTPEPIKDHMPFWYLTNLQNLKAKVDAGEL